MISLTASWSDARIVDCSLLRSSAHRWAVRRPWTERRSLETFALRWASDRDTCRRSPALDRWPSPAGWCPRLVFVLVRWFWSDRSERWPPTRPHHQHRRPRRPSKGPLSLSVKKQKVNDNVLWESRESDNQKANLLSLAVSRLTPNRLQVSV